MSRRTGTVPNPEKQQNEPAPSGDGMEKQKMLLAADTGHFSMIKYVIIYYCDSTISLTQL